MREKMKIQPVEGNSNRRWAITKYGWPLDAGALRVSLQEKRWWGWRTIDSQYAYTPGDIEHAKRLVLNAPMLKKHRREEIARHKKIADDFLDS